MKQPRSWQEDIVPKSREKKRTINKHNTLALVGVKDITSPFKRGLLRFHVNKNLVLWKKHHRIFIVCWKVNFGSSYDN